MARHGFLMVVNTNLQRVARVVTYIESKGESVNSGSFGDERKTGKKKRKRAVKSSNQAWHEDFCNSLAGYFGHEFGLSVLVSCLGESKVDIVRRSYGGPFTRRSRRHRLTVHLRKGEALVMGSGLRHRGCKYTSRNVRLFLAFLVGLSNGASFGSTYSVQDFVRGTKKKGGRKRKTKKGGRGSKKARR